MKRTITKLGRKMLGSLVTCSLVFGMLPAMLISADDALQKSKSGDVEIEVNITAEIDHNDHGVYNGIYIECYHVQGQGDTNDSKIRYNNGPYIKARKTGYHSHYRITLDPSCPYYQGGTITGFTLVTGQCVNQSYATVSNVNIYLGDDFSGPVNPAGDTITKVYSDGTDEVLLGLNNDSANSVYLPIISFVVKVRIPATSITITDGQTAIGDAITMNAGDILSLDATIAPATSTYLANWEVTSASPDGCITITQSTTDNTVTVTAVSPGTATLQASAGDSVIDTVAITVNPAKVTSISYDHDDLALTVGETHTVTNFAVLPQGVTTYPIEWISTNTSVATVDANGVITATGIGSTEVYARCTNGSTSSTDYVFGPAISVTVTQSVTSIAVSPTTLTMTAGGATEQLTLTLTPDVSSASYITISWRSDDESTARVDSNGVVTPVAEGTATITVTVIDKSVSPQQVFEDDCTVTVTDAPPPAPVPVTDISISDSELDLTAGGATGSLSVTLTPDVSGEAYISIVWTTSDSSVATVDGNGIVTPVGAGQAVITVTVTDSSVSPANVFTATCIVTVSAEPAPGPEPGPTPPGPEPGPEPEPEEPVLTYEQITRIVVTNFVERMYIATLDRQYEVTGRDYWVDILLNGGSATFVASGFFNSPEFLSRDVSNEQFVRYLYRVYLDREPDQEGLNNWVNALNNGASRNDVMAEFAKSEEWASLCARYRVVL